MQSKHRLMTARMVVQCNQADTRPGVSASPAASVFAMSILTRGR
jgi:hypothetical protein